MEPLYFPSQNHFRAWLQEHHAKRQELLVGFHKKSSGEPSITWPESVDVALSFGWIDGVRKNVDSTRYTIRFTPRRAGSIWSKINIDRVRELTGLGLMQPPGLKAFEKRTNEKSAIYSYEQRKNATLGEAFERTFRKNRKAWDFFQAQAPSYRRVCSWWVLSAKQEETRQRRLAELIDSSSEGRRVDGK
jgi:uncharacterized protein YdeI (YjbR/CyaY-like superfamily)